eukprot:TRINITY_DN24782_c0_g1_i1.p1 TRINITY_DN24782_c0_g1~~TRINITY_DN24782_c0_g1_i1.p1  ORF type:complete len:582 (-),score=142.50 TRINITY_DN24782_c0_g1_i1:56-1801(-)
MVVLPSDAALEEGHAVLPLAVCRQDLTPAPRRRALWLRRFAGAVFASSAVAGLTGVVRSSPSSAFSSVSRRAASDVAPMQTSIWSEDQQAIQLTNREDDDRSGRPRGRRPGRSNDRSRQKTRPPPKELTYSEIRHDVLTRADRPTDDDEDDSGDSGSERPRRRRKPPPPARREDEAPMDAERMRTILLSLSRKSNARVGRERWQDTLLALEDMRREDITPEAVHWGYIISSHRRCRETQRALDLFKDLSLLEKLEEDEDDLNPFRPSNPSVAYCAAMSACGDAGSWQDAKKIMDEYREGGYKATAPLYTALLTACEKAGEWQQALHFLDEAKEEGVPPDAYLYTAAMSACEKGGQFDPVQVLLVEMWKQGLKPSEVSFNIVMRACANAERWKRALEMLGLMEDEGVKPTVDSYNAAIAACQKSFQGAEIRKLLDEMEERKIQPNANTYISAINAFQAMGNYRTTRDLMRPARKAGVNEKLLRNVKLKGDIPAKSVYMTCIDTAFWQRYPERALELGEEMRKVGYTMGKITLDMFSEASRITANPSLAKRLKQFVADCEKEEKERDNDIAAAMAEEAANAEA